MAALVCAPACGQESAYVASSAAMGEQPTAAARQQSLGSVFEVMPGATRNGAKNRPENISGLRVLLVDDVFTTGSTVKSCAAVLKSAGASWVGAVALAVQPIGALK